VRSKFTSFQSVRPGTGAFLEALSFLCAFTFFTSEAYSQRPNVIIVLLDDAHRNSIPPEGPDFLAYPSISRIYEEGIRFCDAYAVQPLCVPSRYSMFTGLYPHSHSITTNETFPPPDLQTFWTITAQEGYHNQYVGKYSNVQDTGVAGLEKALLIAKVDQKDPIMYLNGQKIPMNGNTTVIIDDSAASWLSVIDTPFIFGVGHIGTHIPLSIVNNFKHAYDGMGLMPNNFYAYTHDYPSFMYSDTLHYYTDSIDAKYNLEKHYEVMLEIDRGVGLIFDQLEARGILDNTMIVFTNDNGLLYGEHLLLGKMDPRDPSATLPLFIRYPEWFDAGEESCGNFVTPMDLFPTILEVTGTDPLPFIYQGTSLNELSEPGNERKAIYYEGIRVADENGLPPDYAPSWRAVRNQEYKYIRHFCDTMIEELFDMVNDPDENNNVVFDYDYNDALNKMRYLMDSLAIVMHDTLSTDTLTLPCYLEASTYTAIQDEIFNELGEIVIFPNPASARITIFLPFGSGASGIQYEVFDATGKMVPDMRGSQHGSRLELDISRWPAGLYYLRAAHQGNHESASFQVIR
jgi:arylsulfatase A-like enzyme